MVDACDTPTFLQNANGFIKNIFDTFCLSRMGFYSYQGKNLTSAVRYLSTVSTLIDLASRV